MRRSLLFWGAAVLVSGPTAIAFFSGGFFDRPRLIAGLVVCALVVVVALTVPRPLPASGPGLIALAGLCLLCIWTTVSVAWAPLGGRALDDVQRLVLYVGFFFCGLMVLRGREWRRWLEVVLALGTLVVVLYALSERLLPGLIELDRSYTAAGRLEQPLSYWNALGLLAAMGLVLTIRVAGDPSRSRALRAGAAAAGVPLGLAIYLTFARGALAALAAGLLVLVALAPVGRPQVRAIVAIIGGSIATSVLATRYPDVKSLDPGVDGDAADGARMLVELVLLSAAAALIVWRRPRRELRTMRLPVSRPTAVLAGAAAVALVATLAVAILEGKPEDRSPALGAGPARLGSVDTNRYRFWDVALDTWASHPLRGIGSGGFQVEWLKQPDRPDTSGDAHSIYLETPAELGIVGLAFLALFVGGIVVGVVRLARLDRALACGPAAALAAFAVHAGLDWDWEMPAVSLVALVLSATVLAWSEELATELAEPDRSAIGDVPRRGGEVAIAATAAGGHGAIRGDDLAGARLRSARNP